ncbi:MAG TPA: ferrous iron transport protein B [Bacillota bacterium]|jgi:ferrous iron transport protein B|nr:ferrous iron transport protein B [Bacillota bacterium]HOL11102.1 ferrous iron transport protein B [Bacillota bacterium]HPO98825.1 ferrous iron transport protein B [Bacillota bacterium]
MDKNIENKQLNVVLIGNPNTGKTSLLNALTGMSLHVGNWPGKTVEKKEGSINYRGYSINIIDLPGTYSIAPYSEEEKVTFEYLKNEEPDVIVQTVDVNALERNLFMTIELLALGKRMVLAFNFNEEAQRRGIIAQAEEISKVLQVPIVSVEANRGKNKELLLDEIIKVSQKKATIPDYMRELIKNSNEIHHDETFKFIKEKISPYYNTSNAVSLTDKIDSVLLNKYAALPIFILIMFLMFATTFILSTPLVDFTEGLFAQLGKIIDQKDLPQFLNSLVVEGIIGGVGTVLAFAPLIFILFLLIAILEDSGYLGRTVIIVDRLFHKFGISGRSFIPMILGFGCNVPAIMATRTIRDKKERIIAIMINSFMSCGARFPVYMLFGTVFFPKTAMFVIMLLYLVGVLVAFVASWLLSKLIKTEEQHALIIELPPYRFPTLKNTLKHAWYHTTEFVKKAGTIIFASVFVIWILSILPLGVEYGSEASLVGQLGKLLTPIFKPLGFGDWRFAISLIFGFFAKEVIIGTLGTIYGGDKLLATMLPQNITPLGALSFLFFVLLYVPCAATLAVIKKETNKWLYALLQVMLSLSTAWIISFTVYQIGLLLGYR